MKLKGVRARDQKKTRQEILEAAFHEIFAHGYQGVSIDDIVKKTSLTKGAFYHHFPSKLSLGYALVEEVLSPMILERWVRPLEAYSNPLEGVLAQMKRLIGRSSAAELRLGCPLNNLVQEMSTVDAGFKRRLQTALQLWIEGTEKHLRRAKNQGFLRKDVNTLSLSKYIVMSHEGFYGFIKGLNDPEAFLILLEPMKVYFDTLTVPGK